MEGAGLWGLNRAFPSLGLSLLGWEGGMTTPSLQGGLGVGDCEAPSTAGHLSVPCLPAEVTPPLSSSPRESPPLPPHPHPGLRVLENLPGQG